MKKYIDVDEIQNIITNCIPLVYFMANTVNEAYENEVEIARTLASKGYSIETIPIPEKIKHGKWLKHYKGGTFVKEGFVSSCCDMWNERKSNFCPNCGAKMEKELKNEIKS